MFSKKSLSILAAGLLICTLWWLGTKHLQSRTHSAFVSLLNIGQGDAILIESTTNDTVLIDTGPDDRVLYELAKALPADDDTIETLILTHSDLDHTGGALAVMNHYTVKRILVSGLKSSAQVSRKIAEKIAEEKIPLIAATSSSDFSFENGEHDGFFNVLYPFRPVIYSSEDANNDSVVMRFSIYNTSFLLTGDMEKEVEEKLLRIYTHGELKADILKLGHHGSKTSSTENFIRAVGPRFAVASMGLHNKFGHPSKEVVERLNSLHIPLRRTDLEGRITLTLSP